MILNKPKQPPKYKMEKISVEIKRKILHLAFGILLVILLMYGIITKLHLLILLILVVILFNLSKKYRIPFFDSLLENFEREQYIKSFPGKGVIFYIVGVLLTLSFFPLDIALPAILVLAFADSVGHLFGIKFGKVKHPYVSKKFIEGWVAGLIAGFLAASIFVPWHEALAASFFAMLVDGIEFEEGADDIDDNLIIPLIAASAIWAVRTIL